MRINWRAVVIGFVVAAVLGLLVASMGPITVESALAFALPGLVGGFVAGYVVSGVGNGAVHGALATVLGGLVLLAIITVVAALFTGIIPALGGAAIALVALAVVSIPGAIAGGVGGWMKGRRTVEPTTATPR